MSVVAIIPARFGSTRLPGKPLAQIGGRPMIQHVYESAAKAKVLDRVIVATDDRRIEAAVKGFGGEVMMTSADHASGTDRLAEVARKIKADLLVNVQGDLPFISAKTISPGGAAVAAQSRYPDGHGVHGDLSMKPNGAIRISSKCSRTRPGWRCFLPGRRYLYVRNDGVDPKRQKDCRASTSAGFGAIVISAYMFIGGISY